MTSETVAPAVLIREFSLHRPLNRVGQPTAIHARLVAAAPVTTQVRLVLPAGVRVLAGDAQATVPFAGEVHLAWTLQADVVQACRLELIVEADGGAATAVIPLCFLPALEIEPCDYIPAPQPAKSRVLIGAHHCPLWEADKLALWDNVVKHPAIHDGLFKSRYADKMRFTIMWENQSRGMGGVADEQDLRDNLLPFWLEHYFTHPSYLIVDNKPVLFIYRPEFLIDDLGGIENVARALELLRQACREAGFDGLYLLGENRGVDAHQLTLMRQMGLDYSFAYCWHVWNNPTPDEAIRAQLEYMRGIQALEILPQVPTVSQAWSGWHDEGTIWKIPPAEFATLLRETEGFMATLPAEELGRRMLLLDNWNEWGEGHYLAPYQEYGFGYLDAVRAVFTDAPAAHRDLIPEDIRRGPYDTAIRTLMRQTAQDEGAIE